MRDRAVSPAIGFVTTLAITLLLVISLFTSTGSLVTAERDQTAQTELEVLGNSLADQLAGADTLVRATDAPTTVRVTDRLPERVAGEQYRIAIEQVGTTGDAYRYRLVVTSPSVGVSAAVDLTTGTPIAETTVDGGPVTVTYDRATGTLEVTG
ncbi:hypothetical protein ACFQGE_16470 [Halomicroarcula sp. GCM10025817]|uniref:DUF7266 family protein n=1 Tax=Haloarcula TaxID=2237 RepID=UPI0023E7F271|nr:hypothetical protein [Halomicroarcula sp. SYNS111]